MDDWSANVPSKYFCLVVLVTHYGADAVFLEEMIHYRWSAEIFCLNEELEFQPSALSYACSPPSTSNHIDFSSIPQGLNDQDGDSVLQSIIYNGVIPTAHVMYSSPIGRKLDSGETILKVLGFANALNHSQPKILGPSILYPVPINNNTWSIRFFLNSVKIGNIVVESFREEFRIFDHLQNMENSSIEYAGDYINISNWHPELSSSSDIMVVALSSEDIIYSFDQFQSMTHEKEVYDSSWQGMNVFHINPNGEWTTTEDFPGLVQRSLCLVKAKVSPTLHSISMMVALSHSRLFVSTLEEEPGAVVMKEIIGVDQKSACNYLSLSNDVCNIVDVAFDSSVCCKVFVLVSDASDSTYQYILLKHSDVSSQGGWSILTTFLNELPALLTDVGQIVTDFQLNSSSPALYFTLNGMNTLSRPDGVIYMWGDVLLVFDIHSSTLGWVPKFLLNGMAKGDTAVQFNSADNKGLYSILTRKGEMWTGVSYPYGRPYSRIIKQLRNLEQTAIISTFFDRQDKLFALTLLSDDSRKSVIRRQQVILQDEPDLNCLSTYNCQNLFTLCQDLELSLHADFAGFTRTREFFLKPPVMTTKMINVPNWWLSDESGQFLTKWWYTQNTALKKHRKYLHFKNSLPNEPLLYLYEGLFEQKRTRGSPCVLPEVIYLDKDERFSFTVVLKHPLSADRLNYNFLRLAIMQSDKSVVKMEVARDVEAFDVRYHINLTGQETVRKLPGESLNTVEFKFYPWNPHMFTTEDKQNSSCCWRSDSGMAFEKNMLVKVGCPPGRRLVFDSQRSQEILQRRGQAASQECFTSSSNLPCFTTSEFVAAFYVEDLVTGERKEFEGNYTLSIVAGGVGYLENIVAYSDTEKEQYNYKPGDNHDTLIWNVLLDLSLLGMQDEATGNLIFDGKNPASIAFECRMDSPCGSIPLGSANPSEYYFEIEASNSRVDSSTNCIYTVRFQIRLIGMQLSPRIHMYLMLVTLTIIMMSLMFYYFAHCCGNDRRRSSYKFGSEDESTREEPPRELRNALARRRKTLVGLTSSYPRSARRSSAFSSQTFNSEAQKHVTHDSHRS